MFKGKEIRLVIASMIFLMLGISQIQSSEIDKGTAAAIASKILKAYFPAGSEGTLQASGYASGLPFFVYNVEPRGFVLVAKDDKCPPVLGYSWESDFPQNPQTAPAMFGTLIQTLDKQIRFYTDQPEPSEKVRSEWNEMTQAGPLKTSEKGLIAPLLATKWAADASYFDLYPGDYRKGGSIPIAMAQVYKYYAFPYQGSGEIEYVLNGVGNFKLKFSDYRFNFSRMSNTEGNPAVDSLVYCMSAACRLQPAGADLESYAQTMVEYYGYSPDMKRVEIWEYEVTPILVHQLSLRRPVPVDWLGHASVIDGYGGTDLFHFNIGEGGVLDGFYLIDYPVVNVGSEHNLLNLYVNYHPRFDWPVPQNVTLEPSGNGVKISWSMQYVDDSIKNLVSRYVILRDGLFPLAETRNQEIILDSAAMGRSSRIMVMAHYGNEGSSELSTPVLWLTDQTLSDIPSIPLRTLINTKLGYTTNLVRQPFKGELELIREMEIDFADQRGIEKLPQLRNLRVDGTSMVRVQPGEYLGRLTHFRFFKCTAFDFTSFTDLKNVIQLYGYDFLPFDLYDFRHNSEVTFINMKNTLPYLNSLMDLYGADKYFPKVSEFYLNTWTQGISGVPTQCFISVESYKDVVPKIRANSDLLVNTQPTVYAPCYPTPAREANVPGVTTLAWVANPANNPDVYYNVYVGPSRNSMEIVSVFQTDKTYNGTFDANKDYYWRVEAFHGDTVYYSGIYHFSTLTSIPFPYTQNFDKYYQACPVTEEIPFWAKSDNSLTGKAITSNAYTSSGYYSLEMKPKSDAGLVFPDLTDSVFNLDFMMMNKYGELGIEILQKPASGDVPVVNARINLFGETLGSFTHTGSPLAFQVTAGTWNHAVVEVHMRSGKAYFWLNDVKIAEWNWFVQMDGTANTRLWKGIRFVNTAAVSGGSGYIDELKITNKNSTGIEILPLENTVVVYNQAANELIINGFEPGKFTNIELYSLDGRLMISKNLTDSQIVRLGQRPENGIYLVVLKRNDGKPLTQKIPVMR